MSSEAIHTRARVHICKLKCSHTHFCAFFHTNSQTYGNVTRAFPVKMLPVVNVWKCVLRVRASKTKDTTHTHAHTHLSVHVRIIVKLYIHLPRVYMYKLQ